MHTDPNVLQHKTYLNDVERAFETSKTGEPDLSSLAFRVQPVVVGLAIFIGAVVSLGGLI